MIAPALIALERPDAVRPKLLDCFSGAGGSARGYQMAGFHVTGIDIKPQPRYAGDVFIQGDALDYIEEHGHEFDAIHTSPPCQEYSPLRALTPDKHYPDLIAPVREILVFTGKPWVIENVMPAPLLSGITLCGGMFGLRTYRHRRFESSLLMFQPDHPKHVAKTSTKKRKTCWDAGMHISVTGDIGSTIGGLAMGIDWMTGNELSQAIPPAYTSYIGSQIMAAIQNAQPEPPVVIRSASQTYKIVATAVKPGTERQALASVRSRYPGMTYTVSRGFMEALGDEDKGDLVTHFGCQSGEVLMEVWGN